MIPAEHSLRRKNQGALASATPLLLCVATLSIPAFGSVAAAQAETDDTTASEASGDGWQLPDDLDDPDDGWQLPDDLDGGDDEFNFDAIPDVDEDEGPSITFSATSTTVAQYRFQNFNRDTLDDDFLSLWERLELNLQVDDFRLNARVDGFLPLFEDECPDGRDPDTCFQSDLRLERVTAHYDLGDLALDAGDSYAVLGRGIALSLRRVDLIGIDTALRGGQLAYDNGDVFVKLLGGAVNPQNLDPQTLRIRHQPVDQLRGDFRASEHDWIVGGEAGVRLGQSRVELGLHGQHVIFARPHNARGNDRTRVNVGGWHLSVPSIAGGLLSFYGEVNALQRVTTIDDTEERDFGRAIYASAQAQLGNGTLLLEWKDYRNYSVSETNTTGDNWRIYSAAPTLERDAERPEALFNARGGRLQLDWGFLPGPWSMSATMLAYGHAEHVDMDPWDGVLITHGYAKIQKINDAIGADELGWTFDLELGYRRGTFLHADEILNRERGDRQSQVMHGTLEAGLVFGSHSFELRVDQRFERKVRLSETAFVRGGATLTWSWAGRLRISPVLNWNTENESAPSLYPGAEVRYDFLQGSFARIFGGRTPGGLVCSGGVCREVPPFEGVLLELVLRI